jgi:spore germination protein KA
LTRQPGWIEQPVIPCRPLAARLDDNIAAIGQAMGDAPDLIIRRFRIGAQGELDAALLYINGMVDVTVISDNILSALFDASQGSAVSDLSPANAIALVKERGLSVANAAEFHSLEEALHCILGGETVLFLDGSTVALRLETTGYAARDVEHPDTEVVVRGSREGFTETLQTNLSLLRRRLRTPDLRLEKIRLGERTGTAVCVAYLKGVAKDELVEEVRSRLRRIKIDGILESGYVENLIEDAAFSPFPTVGNSEKPDTVAAKLLEGRVAILVDGTPFVLSVPYLFVETFQVAEDYYSRPFYATLIRWVRYAAFAVTLMAPAFTVAVQTFQPELLPPPLMLTMGANREGIPVPALLEALGMMLVFEVLKEAGVRMPRPVGQAVSIVGALVIGESAVRAGLVSNTMVVSIGFMGIAGFVLPPIADPVGVLRYPMLLLAGTFGLPGITFGLMGLLTHMVGLRSFGVPYLSPLAPAHFSGWKDVVYRSPWWAMTRRPPLIGAANPRRVGPSTKRPTPGSGGGSQP